MLVVLLTLLAATPSAVPTVPVVSDEVVVAWQPADAPRARAHQTRRGRDDTAQAVAAILPVAGGVLVGSFAAVLAVGVAAAFPAGAAPAVIVAALAFVAAPSIAVALLVPDLPGWAPWLTAMLVPLGGVAVGGAMLVVSDAWLDHVTPPGSDCRACGRDGLLVLLGVPVATVLGATVGGLAATTIAAYAPE